LLIALAVVLADLVWALVPVPEGAGIELSGQRGTSIPQQQDSDGLMGGRPSRALKILFGKASEPDEIKNLLNGPVHETDLNLTLKGILADRNSEKKFALIAQGEADEMIYRIGDNIAGADLIYIDSRRVIIQRNGKNESLSLKTEDLQKKSERNTYGSSRARNSGRSNDLDADSHRIVFKETLDQHLDILPQILKQAKTVPYIKDGRQAGFKVLEIDKRSIINDLGLKQNDVIRAVNGISVHNNKEALQAYQNLKTATAFQVDILRDGREVTIDYSIR